MIDKPGHLGDENSYLPESQDTQHQTKAWVSGQSHSRFPNTGLSSLEFHEVLQKKDLWNRPFIMLANIPYFAVNNTNREDTRTFAGKDKLRRRYEFSFLDLPNSTDENSEAGPFLYELVCSLMVTGKSDVDWTAVCLNEDSFANAKRFETEDEVEMDGLIPDEEIDPIIQEPKLSKISPRTYFLQAVASFFATVVEDEEDIKERFWTSLNRHSPNPPKGSEYYLDSDQTKQWTNRALELLPKILTTISQQKHILEEFLTDEVKFGEDEIPKGRFFQSLSADQLAIKSLRSLRTRLKELEGVEGRIERSKKQFEEIRLERQHENGDAQRDLGLSVRTLTFSTVLLVFSGPVGMALSRFSDEMAKHVAQGGTGMMPQIEKHNKHSDVGIGIDTQPFTEMWSQEDDGA
ncbi:hypothetical protein QQX98_010083 [Neonectria punicea]|uniref:Uncharacterized protein n=1 Tax=Neonectria punicea TaxID=979145 RepID=A0ABR1GQD5_9HYPO